MFALGLIVVLIVKVSAGFLLDDLNYVRMTNFYDDVGCTVNSGKHYYDCSEVMDAYVPGKCQFRGKVYSDDEFIPDDARLSACKFGCICSAPKKNETGVFECPVVDCFPHSELKPGCVNVYSSLSSCCSSDSVCENEVKKTCRYDGTTFLEGQIFYPKPPRCLKCRCQEDFNLMEIRPKTLSEGGACMPIFCNVGIDFSEEVYKRCGPVFSKEACCPWEFYCPTEEKQHFGMDSKMKTAGIQQCQLGDARYDVGDKIETKDNTLICSCIIPPFVTCSRVG